LDGLGLLVCLIADDAALVVGCRQEETLADPSPSLQDNEAWRVLSLPAQLCQFGGTVYQVHVVTVSRYLVLQDYL
jgi:hypothetical protein